MLKEEELFMLRRANELMGFTLGAREGEIGRVKDFYFEDDSWTVRYLVVDTGKWLPLRSVLISPWAILGFNDREKVVEVSLTRDQVKACPSTEENAPVSRQYEREYYRYYGWPHYWQGPGLWGPSTEPVLPHHPGPELEETAAQPEQQSDPHLRSVSEVTGYHLEAQDGASGHVEDCVIADGDWVIQYLVIDTRNWWPGKKVLLPPQWAVRVDWEQSRVQALLGRVAIKQAPEYDPSVPITREYEARLFGYYNQQPYWERRLAA